MKKYILNLFPVSRERCSSKKEYAERIGQVARLAVAIAEYNNEPPEVMGEPQDFVNYLHNAIPYTFFFFEASPRHLDVQFRDEQLRAGTIETVTV